MGSAEDLIRGIKIDFDRSLDKTEEINHGLWPKNKLVQIASNINFASGKGLLRGMLAWRVDANLEEMQHSFSKGSRLAPDLVRLPTVIRESLSDGRILDGGSAIQRRCFENAIFLALLQNKFEFAVQLSQVAMQPEVIDNDDINCYAARLLVALLLEDEHDFVITSELYSKKRRKNDTFDNAQAIYIDLFGDLLNKDIILFMEHLKLADEGYKKRKKLRSLTLQYGGGDFNAVCFDYKAVALCKLAIHRGMDIKYDSVYIPAAVINYGLAQ